MELPETVTATTCYLAIHSLSTTTTPGLRPTPWTVESTEKPGTGSFSPRWVFPRLTARGKK